jgi:hypothetical protein
MHRNLDQVAGKQGAQLQFQHVEPLQKMWQVAFISFLSDDSGEEDGEEALVGDGDSQVLDTNKRQAAIHGYIIKTSMSGSIAPELIAMERAHPRILQCWMEHGIEIIASADSTAVLRFNDWSIKLEVGAAKIIAPDAVGAEGPSKLLIKAVHA